MKNIFFILVSTFLLLSCGGTGKISERYKDDTRNHRFRLVVYTNEGEQNCSKMEVRVKPRAKLYTSYKPPNKVSLYDKDCESPQDWEWIKVRKTNGDFQSFIGNDISRFFSKYEKLKFELDEFLFEKGITKRGGPLK